MSIEGLAKAAEQAKGRGAAEAAPLSPPNQGSGGNAPHPIEVLVAVANPLPTAGTPLPETVQNQLALQDRILNDPELQKRLGLFRAQPRYAQAQWGQLLDGTFEGIKRLTRLKGGEYSGDDDRLLNFRRNGEALGLPMETVWAVYAAKHWDAIQQFIRDERNGVKRERLEGIDGRVDDMIAYLLLFKAMLDEKASAPG